MKQRITCRQLAVLALCIAMSLTAKRLVSPFTNLITDFIRIPGGSASTAFSLLFLVLGSCYVPWRWAATAAAFVQSLLALSLGMSSYQGLFAILTYTLPGIVIDLVRSVIPISSGWYFVLSCCMANMAGAMLTSLLVFHLQGLALVLWLLVACLFGLVGGLLAGEVYWRLLGAMRLEGVAA